MSTNLEQVREEAQQHGAERGAQVGGGALDRHLRDRDLQSLLVRNACAAAWRVSVRPPASHVLVFGSQQPDIKLSGRNQLDTRWRHCSLNCV